ncbi:hypothetical protein SLS58_009260 [Diplodia intermedia]|uniref:AAA+ ATPase domain-containing protein n=1 Tax=Diplodia intermedia TaxID=856260 RepID=A0ABR3TDM1_9PEZI
MAISSDRRQAYRVVDVSVLVENDTSKGALSIGCVHLDYDGQSVGPVHTKFKIRKYKGRQRVASLPIHAFCMNSDPAGVRETLVGRGRNFVKVSAGKHMYCQGTSLTSREHVDGQVMVDFQQAIRRNPHWTPAIIGAASNIDEDEDDVWESIQAAGIPDSLLQLREIGHGDAKLSDDELMLLSHRVFGFILRTRKWAAFDVSDLHEMHDKTGSEGFKRLALPRGHREKLEPLLRQHFRQRQSIKDDISSEIDFFRREQLGLTILLHGVPGVGKTLTAECVASHFSRPLFPLSYNDLLGGVPAEVTAQLEEVFALAAAWDAVLLVEDAEPLLFPPSGDDYTSNTSPAAAAAFLRVVDNYPGLLFLTTTTSGSSSGSGSRVNNALHSRLRLSLFYPPLDERATLDVWDIGIWQAKRQHPSMRIKADEVLNFAAERHNHRHPSGRWNGRQIRNAFWNAIALAEDEASYSSGGSGNGNGGGGGSIREKREQRRKSLRSTTTTTTVTLRRRHFELVAEASEDFDGSVAAAAVGGNQPQQAPLPLSPPAPPKFRHERQDSSSNSNSSSSFLFREADRQRSRTTTTTTTTEARPATALVRSNTLPTGGGGGGGGGGSFEQQLLPPQQRRRGTTVVSRAFAPGLPPLPKLPRMMATTAAAEQQQQQLPPLPLPLPAGRSAGQAGTHVRRHSQLSMMAQQQQERLHGREPLGTSGGGGSRYASPSTRSVKVAAPAQQQKRRSSRSGEGEGGDDWSETRQDSGAEEWTNAEVERNLIDNFTAIAYK